MCCGHVGGLPSTELSSARPFTNTSAAHAEHIDHRAACMHACARIHVACGTWHVAWHKHSLPRRLSPLLPPPTPPHGRSGPCRPIASNETCCTSGHRGGRPAHMEQSERACMRAPPPALVPPAPGAMCVMVPTGSSGTMVGLPEPPSCSMATKPKSESLQVKPRGSLVFDLCASEKTSTLHHAVLEGHPDRWVVKQSRRAHVECTLKAAALRNHTHTSGCDRCNVCRVGALWQACACMQAREG